MRKLILLPALLLLSHLSFGQTPYTVIQTRFNIIKRIVQPDIIQLPDSVIIFPLIGLTNIINVPGNMLSGPYVEIEMWIIDSKGKIIYNNVIANQNDGSHPLEAEYCRYMKLQSNYVRHQHHSIETVAIK
jgi:hypothetical protein